MLVKEITPALHRLQEAFLVYEDQNEGQDDRGWYPFAEMFTDVDLVRFSKQEALKTLLVRFAYRLVWFDADMARAFYRLPAKDIDSVLKKMVVENTLAKKDGGYVLTADLELLKTTAAQVPKSVYAMHRNDILVKCCEPLLKEKYTHSYPDTLYYLLIDGQWQGAVVGKFRYTPEVEDVMLDLPDEAAKTLREEILAAIHMLCGENNPIKRFKGKAI
ncbi:MAG: hypothetical protein LBM65_04750, partial [Oscillospiraceae bacterium]|jgi:hypothetical protein|nr:hypothetical protein [Oscillospiraceae bacterium]